MIEIGYFVKKKQFIQTKVLEFKSLRSVNIIWSVLYYGVRYYGWIVCEKEKVYRNIDRMLENGCRRGLDYFFRINLFDKMSINCF